MPTREDIDPGALRGHLAHISIIDFQAQGSIRFRLAGSKVCALLGRDLKGATLQQLTGRAADMWQTGLADVIETQTPIGGVTDRGDDRHAWLRMPVYDAHSDRCQILCHDMILTKVKTGAHRDQSSPLSHTGSCLAA